MEDDKTTIDLASAGSSRKVSDLELARREEAKKVSPLAYWEHYIAYRREHRKNPTMWNRDKFLEHLQVSNKLKMPPSGSSISGKHNYCTDTLIPSLAKDPTSPWYGMEKAQLDKAKLPPTARDTKETWQKNKELAEATKNMFDDE
jgi:hypothetical protein